MAALDMSQAMHLLERRKGKKTGNFAQREPGVILVFCIVGAIALLVIGLTVQKRLAARRAAKA